MKSSVNLIAIDPSSSAYCEDRLFDASNLVLNRDDTLSPFIRLKAAAALRGIKLQTADLIFKQGTPLTEECDYYSLGVLTNFRQLNSTKNVNLKAFLILEPPVVDKSLYQALPELTAVFERVYVHNTIGDGYSLKGVDQSKLRQLYWPQPCAKVIQPLWSRQPRQRRIVMINGNHKPGSFDGELYSKRIEAMVELTKTGVIDLYGRGWERWWSRSSMWLPYWRNRKTIMSIYKGACASKYEVMSNYTFALCFENMAMQGYVTEKIFDCFYAGTIPLYFGASNISDLIPKDAFIDCRIFATWAQLTEELLRMSEERIRFMKEAGGEFIRTDKYLKYFTALEDIVKFD